jgi:hypothetical protein
MCLIFGIFVISIFEDCAVLSVMFLSVNYTMDQVF